MTDIEQERIKAICKVAHIDDISDLSDGYHTFKQLYYQRMMLFAVLVKQNHDKAWKSLRHENGELCFGGGWFIVGIDTPKGSYTYHYEDNYFSLFDCVELERGKKWDGHTEKDVTRLLSLEQEYCDDVISRQAVLAAMRKNHRSGGRDIDGDYIEGDYRECLYDDVTSLPSVTHAEKTVQFAEWVAREIFDDNWEYNKDAFAELACRQLAKLGIVRAKGNEWELVESQESDGGVMFPT